MKKNKLFRFFSVAVIAAAMAVTALPATAFADDVAEEPVVEETAEVVEEGDTQKEDAGEFTYVGKDVNIFETDLESISDDELNDIILSSSKENVSAWITSLPDSDVKNLLERDTVLVKSYDIFRSFDDSEDVTHESYETYYEYLTEVLPKEKVSETYTYNSTSGTCTIKNTTDNKTATVKVSKFTKNVTTAIRQTGLEWEVNDKAGCSLSYVTGGTKTWRKHLLKKDEDPYDADHWKKDSKGKYEYSTYGFLIYKLSFTVPKGYYVTKNSEDGASKGQYGVKVNDSIKWDGSTEALTNLGDSWKNTLNGAGGTETMHIIANVRNFGITNGSTNITHLITFSPITYTVAFPSGTVNCTYNQNATAPVGSAKDVGTVTATYDYNYDNKGTYTSTTKTATQSFDYWNIKDGGASVKTVGPGASFSNATNILGKSLTAEAVYKNPTYPSHDVPAGPSRTGYNFEGWYDGNGTKLGATVAPTGNTTYYAKWTPNTYTITYSANGGTLSKSSDTATYDADVPARPTGTKEGYTLTGWTWNGYGGSGKYTYAGNSTATAVWTPVSYNITYDTVGGSLATTNPGSYTIESETFTLNNPTKKGYVFAGWKEGTSETANTTATINKGTTGNKSFTATWTPIKYVVKYDAGNGDNIPDKGANYDEAFVLPTVSKAGYIFKGWMLGSDKVATDDKNNVSNLTDEDGKELTLTASWEPIKYNVTFDADGGSAVEDIQCTYDNPLVLPSSEKKDYEFGGWMMNAGTTDETIVTTAQNLTTTDGSTVTLKAKWINQVFTAKFEAGEGATKIQDTKYKFGETTALPVPTKPNDKKYSYAFDGWVLAAPTSEEYANATILKTAQDIKPDDVAKAKTADNSITIYARWTQNLLPQNNGTNTAVNTQTTTYNNEYGLDIEEAKKWLADLIGGTVSDLNIKGVRYVLYKNSDGTISIKMVDMKNQKELTIPDAIKIGDAVIPITSIDREAFKNNTVLEKVIFGKNVTTIGDSAFEGCKKLKSVTMNEGLVTIGNRAFYGCSALTQIKTPSTVKTIGNSAFENCTKLSKVTLNNGLLDIGNAAFKNCKALTSITIPKSVLKIGDSAFEKCTKLKTVKFAKGSNLQSIGKNAFANCTALTKINLPNKLSKLSTKAFYNCKKLSKVTGGKGLVTIGDKAFMNCVKLGKFTIWKKVVTVGKQAFYNDKALKSVTIKSKVLTKVGTKAFKKTHKKIIFTVPNKAKKAAYKKLLRGKY